LPPPLKIRKDIFSTFSGAVNSHSTALFMIRLELDEGSNPAQTIKSFTVAVYSRPTWFFSLGLRDQIKHFFGFNSTRPKRLFVQKPNKLENKNFI